VKNGERAGQTVKILLINNDKGWSGGQEHLKDLATELARHGVEVHFVVRAGSPSEARFRSLGPVYAMPAHGAGDVKALFALASVMRRECFDIVSVNREHDLAMTALARHLAFPLRKPGRMMMSYHTATARKQLFIGAADAIVCISEHVRARLLAGNPGVADRTTILYYGITLDAPPGTDKFDPDRARRFFTGEHFPLIGMVGEFWKNQGELVDVLALLTEEFPAIRVAFVGDNSDQGLFQPLRDKIRRLGLERQVIFTGRIPRERIPDVFFDFDLSVTTHRNEGFGIVHLESLAAGTPVVTYDEGGMVDILRGEEVGAIVAGGAREFAAAVAGLLRDHSRRFVMGGNGYRLVERKYSLAAMGQRYLEFYRLLLTGKETE
jgi:glycosyltransferase involved in cell wall biosynthesis